MPFAPAQERRCILFVYRIVNWRDRDYDPCTWHYWFDNRLQPLRDIYDDNNAGGGSGVFDLVFAFGPTKGLDQEGIATR